MFVDQLSSQNPSTNTIDKQVPRPRCRPSIWKEHGKSYAELQGTVSPYDYACSSQHQWSSSVNDCFAGVPSATLPKGAGTFRLEVHLNNDAGML
jgi:hypothetical protein